MPGWEIEFNRLDRLLTLRGEVPAPSPAVKVLYGPSFSVFGPCFALDRTLSLALQKKGATVVPVYCDGIQEVECNYFGGDWMGGKSFRKSCQGCQESSNRLWKASPFPALKLSEFLSAETKERIAAKVRSMSHTEQLNYTEDEIQFGQLAKDILVNNYLVSSIDLVADRERLLGAHLENLLRIHAAYSRLIDEEAPTRVVSNDSYYGMWAILEILCKKAGIPFYSHWPVTLDRVAFAFNDAAMNLDFKLPWARFSKEPLTQSDLIRVHKWLSGARNYVLELNPGGKPNALDKSLDQLDRTRPTAVMTPNVSWDLAALNKQLIFDDMAEWIVQTIGWFAENPQFQLVIKPHPVEKSRVIPNTNETVARIIQIRNIKLPENVVLMKPDAPLGFSELMQYFSAKGVLVHTSSTGFECPALGIPAITTGKSPYRGFGFTIDPNDKAEYFSAVRSILESDAPSLTEEQILLAKKFICFYQFHYYAHLDLFTGNPPRPSVRAADNISNPTGALNYFVDAIIKGEPLLTEDKWPPSS